MSIGAYIVIGIWIAAILSLIAAKIDETKHPKPSRLEDEHFEEKP